MNSIAFLERKSGADGFVYVEWGEFEDAVRKAAPAIQQPAMERTVITVRASGFQSKQFALDIRLQIPLKRLDDSRAAKAMYGQLPMPIQKAVR